LQANGVSEALRDRLGGEATLRLLELIETRQQTWSDRVLTIAVERFERRLSEDIGRFRVEVVREIHDIRWNVLSWMFVFWVGQFFAVGGLLAYLLRVSR